ncbi:MAG: RNA polymerase sigma factor [Candidatus Omnitrophica bacterium]|nr:RNA polymerase sigma factor [Candidatus Omnitrophota bacterium]
MDWDGHEGGIRFSVDREAFLRALLPQLNSLYSFSRWLTHDGDEAEDIVHDALSRVFLNGNCNLEGGEIRTYLFTIIRRTYINRLRRGRYEATSAGYPEDESTLSAPSEKGGFSELPPELLRQDLNEALAGLHPDSRSVVILADVEGFSVDEIAQVMNIPAGTVKSKLWRAHQALRKKLKVYQEPKGK